MLDPHPSLNGCDLFGGLYKELLRSLRERLSTAGFPGVVMPEPTKAELVCEERKVCDYLTTEEETSCLDFREARAGKMALKQKKSREDRELRLSNEG